MMTLDVVDTGRRRRWTDPEKLRVVEEGFAGSRLVSATARRHGISRSLLTTWRRLHQQGLLLGGRDAAPGFARVTVAPDRPEGRPGARSASPIKAPARVEIVLLGGRRLLVDAGMDPAALVRLIAVVEGV